MQEGEPAARQALVEGLRQHRGVGLAVADQDGAAAVEPAQHQGALQRLPEAQPPLGGLDPGHVGTMAGPLAPGADHVVGDDVDDLAGQPGSHEKNRFYPNVGQN